MRKLKSGGYSLFLSEGKIKCKTWVTTGPDLASLIVADCDFMLRFYFPKYTTIYIETTFMLSIPVKIIRMFSKHKKIISLHDHEKC